MPGAFDASARFDHDPLATAEEIQHGGEEVLRWLEAVATADEPWPLDIKLIGFIVAEANTLAIRVYDIHPFIDGNTRATWHLRNYALMLDGLPPVVDLADLDRYERAWWGSSTEDHDELDAVVIAELAAQQSSK